MAGRPRLPIGTFGEISTTKLGAGRFQAHTRFRDWDGRTRQVTATAPSANAAKTLLRTQLAERVRLGDQGDGVTADSPFSALADAWLGDVRNDPDRAEGTKEVYERQLRSLVLPAFEQFSIREVTVSRIGRFLKGQRAQTYSKAKYSRAILSIMFAFAVRRGIVPRNPVRDTSRLRKPKSVPKALTPSQIASIRVAAAEWRTGESVRGPRPDGQVRDIIELMLGSMTRIGEVLALRRCDVDMTADPPRMGSQRRSGTLPVGPHVVACPGASLISSSDDPAHIGTARRPDRWSRDVPSGSSRRGVIDSGQLAIARLSCGPILGLLTGRLKRAGGLWRSRNDSLGARSGTGL